tara:strand:- start:198 stop:878 length:681 start_codon:yes stop_codon:yes gene_type:complete
MENVTLPNIIEDSINNIKIGAYLSSTDIIIALIMSLICSIVIYYTYEKTYQGVLYQHTFGLSLILITMITTVIIITISGNLILSLGMVGALSIVRFRTAVKEPLDIVFMFWAISLGIANGVAYFKLSIIAVILISSLIFLLKKIKIEKTPYILILNYKEPDENEILKKINSSTDKFKIKTKNTNGSDIQLTLEIQINDKGKKLNSKLKAIKSNFDYSLIAYSNDIE